MTTTTRKTPDPRDQPLYTVAEAAQYLQLPRTTLASWTKGRGLIQPAKASPPVLSFLNLVEAFVLSAIRRKHEVPMQRARKALQYVKREMGVARPLVTVDFRTDGLDLFVERYGRVVNVSQDGAQLLLREAIEGYLERIEWDDSGLAERLFPLARSGAIDQPRAIMIDPRLGFGRPVIAGTGIRTEIVIERYRAGESMSVLADDYGVAPDLIEDAVRLGLLRAAA